MTTGKDISADTAAARGEAAEESAAAQPTHYHSRLEAEEPSRADAPSPTPAKVGGEARHARVSAQPPEEFTGGEFEGASEVSGGLAAVWSATKHIVREAGVVRGTRALLKVNQKDGFDCPGCAWPDPDGERSHAEFCENGAKAVAEEATTRRVTPEFFAEWIDRRPLAQVRLLARQAGAPHAPDGPARRRDALRADRVGRGFQARSPES